jgi:hypothetical protein
VPGDGTELVSREVSPYPDYMLSASASHSWSKNNNTFFETGRIVSPF